MPAGISGSTAESFFQVQLGPSRVSLRAIDDARYDHLSEQLGLLYVVDARVVLQSHANEKRGRAIPW
jgi:hypothetical protein